MTPKLCSACLLGIKCKYDGKDDRLSTAVKKLYTKDVLIPVCPEQLGGLPTPREPCGIYGGLGSDVFTGIATVRTVKEGKDKTKYFLEGAKETLKIATLLGIKEAILKQKSPSCGCGLTWQLDDNFENHPVNGDGVTAALLKKNGINVISEEDL